MRSGYQENLTSGCLGSCRSKGATARLSRAALHTLGGLLRTADGEFGSAVKSGGNVLFCVGSAKHEDPHSRESSTVRRPRSREVGLRFPARLHKSNPTSRENHGRFQVTFPPSLSDHATSPADDAMTYRNEILVNAGDRLPSVPFGPPGPTRLSSRSAALGSDRDGAVRILGAASRDQSHLGQSDPLPVCLAGCCGAGASAGRRRRRRRRMWVRRRRKGRGAGCERRESGGGTAATGR